MAAALIAACVFCAAHTLLRWLPLPLDLPLPLPPPCSSLRPLATTPPSLAVLGVSETPRALAMAVLGSRGASMPCRIDWGQ